MAREGFNIFAAGQNAWQRWMLCACIPGCPAAARLFSLSGERLPQAISSRALKGTCSPVSVGSLFRPIFMYEKSVYLRAALQDRCLLEGKIRSTAVQRWMEEKLALVKDSMVSIVTVLLYAWANKRTCRVSADSFCWINPALDLDH